MEQKPFLPRQILHIPRRPSVQALPTLISPETPSLSFEEAQKKALQLLTERKSHNGEVVGYQPYYYTVEGVNGRHELASRYASVEIEGKKAWFEIIQDTPELPVTEIAFLTSHPLHTILGDTENSDNHKLSDQIDNPQPGKSLIRLVTFDEFPLVEDVSRVTDPNELLIASQKIVEHLLEGHSQPDSIKVAMPAPEEISTFSEEQLSFTPIFERADGTSVGQGKKINATVGDGESRELFVYPARTIKEDGQMANRYLISTEDISQDGLGNYAGVVGREDSICGCEKFGNHVLNHSCGHEILGSLQKQPKAELPIVIAWDPSADCNGNGSIMHSLKANNAERVPHVTPDFLSFASGYDYDLAKKDRRDFDPLAKVLAATVEFLGTNIFILQSSNQRKVSAMEEHIHRIEGKVFFVPTSHESKVVPDNVRNFEKENGERPDKYPERQRRHSLQVN